MARGRAVLALCALVVLVWLLLGMIVYKIADNCATDTICSSSGQLIETQACGWNWAQSFYYSVQTGLSIGFGVLPESRDGSRLYSVFHIMLGSSIVGGILAMFISMAITRNTASLSKMEENLARYARTRHMDGYKGFKVEELRGMMRKHPHFYRDILELVEGDDARVELKVDRYIQMTDADRKRACDELIQEAHTSEELKGGRLSIDDLKRIRAEERGAFQEMKAYFKDNSTFIIAWTSFTIWIALGVVYGLTVEEWSFIQSLYFAVSTLSTAGLQGVTQVPSGWHVLLAAFYALFGVPLYGAALGTLANVVVDRYNDKVFEEKMNFKLKASEIEFVKHISGKDGDDLNQAEFMEVQLLKLGKVDRDLLTQLRNQFRSLDKDSSGTINKDSLINDHKRRIGRLRGES